MTTSANPGPATARQDQPAESPEWRILPIILTGVFMSVLDAFIVIVAIPSIQRDLHSSEAAIQWVITGFALAYGASLITGSRLGDIFGRRRVFTIGLNLFTLSSLACGLAPNTPFLLVSRIAEGIAAGLMSPQALTILGLAFRGEARARAFSAYGVVMGIAGVIGQLLGGLLIEANFFGSTWRPIFLINVPFGIAAAVLVPRVVPESHAPRRPRLDIVGMIILATALVALVLPLIEGRQEGWPLWSWLCLAASAPLFLLFGLYEHVLGTRDRGPLVSLVLFRERAFTVGLLVQLAFWTGQGSFFLVLALYLQQGRGLGPLGAGLIIIPQGVGYLLTSTNAHHLARRLGRQVIAVGALLRVIGLGLLIITVASIGVGGHVALLTPALVIDGAGMGMAIAPLAATVLARVSPQHAGAASGVLITALHVGNSLGVAIVGMIFYDTLGHTLGTGTYPRAFNLSLVYILAVIALISLLVQLLPRVPGAPKPAPPPVARAAPSAATPPAS
jgi:EmrB/QacA subfamily drug resistance transporter